MFMFKSSKSKIILVLVLAMFSSLFYSFYFSISPMVDAQAYNNIAWNLVSGKGYAETPEIPRLQDFSIGRVGPGYEFFLAFIYSFFGQNFQIVWIIQALLHLGSGALVFLISKNLFSEDREKIGIIGAALFVFFIDTIELNAMLMTETLMLFLLILSIYLFIKFYYKPTTTNVILLAVAGTLASLVRPTLLLILGVFLVFSLSRRFYKQAGIFVVCSFLVFTPWVVRNYIVFDQFILTTAIGGYDLWVGNNPLANGELDPSTYIRDFSSTHNVLETSEKGINEVLSFVLEKPFEELKLLATKTSIYFSFARPAAFWFHLHGLDRVVTIILSSSFAFILFTFGLSGVWYAWKERDALKRWIIVIALTMPLSVIPIVVETRYRYSFYPFLAFFTGYFIFLLKRKVDPYSNLNQKLKTYILVTIILSANTIFDFFKNLEIVKEKLFG